MSAGARVAYTLSIGNQNEPGCEPEIYRSSTSTLIDDQRFRIEPLSQASAPVASGQTTQLTIAITGNSDDEPGSYPLDFFVYSEDPPSSAARAVLSAHATANYTVKPPEGCYVSPSRGLLVRHPSVVDDPQRTLTAGGAWTFGHLMEQLAPSADGAADVTEAMFRSFASRQTINGFSVAARRNIEPTVLEPWPRSDDGKFDLSRAPMRLLAIAHRLDLADLEQGKAGEGRFVFAITDSNSSEGALLFTVILEYLLPAANQAQLHDWALAVHALQSVPFPSEEYNRALQAVTDRFTARGAVPAQPNGSALLRIRTNENALALDGRWQMREFQLSSETGSLMPAPLQQTPDASFRGSARLSSFIEANRASILRETHVVPALLDGSPFQAGAVLNVLNAWEVRSALDPEVRHLFSLNTCDGCHGGETNTSFFHVFPRVPGQQSRLSTFLKGGTELDPSTKLPRTYGELARRGQLLERIVCN